MYEIAKRFSLEARAAAAAATYVPTEVSTNRRLMLRTDDGYCPLGVMIREDYPSDDPVLVPIGNDVIEALDITDERECERVRDETEEFFAPWDDGRITNLAEALGLGEGFLA